MTEFPPDGTAAVRPPVVTLGPPGSGFLSIDHTVEDALLHVREHTTPTGGHTAHAGVAAAELILFDGAARKLRLDTSGATPHLSVTGDRDHSGELYARIEEVMAHARAEAYDDPELLERTGLTSAALLRPPAAGDLDAYLAGLIDHVTSVEPPEEHVGGWWHNLFHRLG